MRTWWTLVKRELGGYLGSLSGYVIIGSILLLLGFSFTDMLAKLNATPTHVPLTEMFYSTYYFWQILLLTAPVITMRAFAQERFSGTYETLMTAPVSDLQVVLAKYAGAYVIYLVAWLPLFGCMAVIRYYAHEPSLLDLRSAATTYIGIALIGSVYMALGCFGSSLTRSQIIAVMNSFALGLTLFLLSLRSLAAEAPADWAAQAFAYIAMSEHMEDFVRGIIDTRHLVFYGSLTALFLFLTLKVVESRRWK